MGYSIKLDMQVDMGYSIILGTCSEAGMGYSVILDMLLGRYGIQYNTRHAHKQGWDGIHYNDD